MSRLIRPRLTHMGLCVRDLPMMLGFYTSAPGLIITGHSKAMPVEPVFLSNEPDKHHQVVIASGRPDPATFSTINQVSFAAADDADLDALPPLFRPLARAGRRIGSLGAGLAQALTCGERRPDDCREPPCNPALLRRTTGA